MFTARLILVLAALLPAQTPRAKTPAAPRPSVPAQTFNRQLRTSSDTLPARLKLRWKYKTGGPVVSSAAVSGDRLFIGSGDKNIYALGLRDGKKLWAYKTKDTV